MSYQNLILPTQISLPFLLLSNFISFASSSALISSSQCFDCDSELNQHQFHLITPPDREPFDFFVGRKLCKKLHSSSDVASIRSQQEQQIIVNFIQDCCQSTNGIFIGLFDFVFDNTTENFSTERFTWLDGAEFSFGAIPSQFPWLHGRPNNFGPFQEDCVEIKANFDYLWNDISCDVADRRILCRSKCFAEFQPHSGAPTTQNLNPTASPTVSPSSNYTTSEDPEAFHTTEVPKTLINEEGQIAAAVIGALALSLVLIGLIVDYRFKRQHKVNNSVEDATTNRESSVKPNMSFTASQEIHLKSDIPQLLERKEPEGPPADLEHNSVHNSRIEHSSYSRSTFSEYESDSMTSATSSVMRKLRLYNWQKSLIQTRKEPRPFDKRNMGEYLEQ